MQCGVCAFGLGVLFVNLLFFFVVLFAIVLVASLFFCFWFRYLFSITLLAMSMSLHRVTGSIARRHCVERNTSKAELPFVCCIDNCCAPSLNKRLCERTKRLCREQHNGDEKRK